jgi:hypothetical protein
MPRQRAALPSGCATRPADSYKSAPDQRREFVVVDQVVYSRKGVQRRVQVGTIRDS